MLYYFRDKLFTHKTINTKTLCIHTRTNTHRYTKIHKDKKTTTHHSSYKIVRGKKVVKRGVSPVEFDRPRLRCEESAKVIFGTAAGKRET